MSKGINVSPSIRDDTVRISLLGASKSTGALNDRVYMKKDTLSDFPSPQEFFIDTPLYREVDLRMYIADMAYAIEYFDGTIDAYCIECGQTSVFKVKSRTYFPGIGKYKEDYLEDDEFEISISCSRNYEHKMYFYFVKRGGKLSKVGQMPSIADLYEHDVKKYRNVLGGKYIEFTRAIGLAANGIGIGSFTYLRRVFYELTEKAHERAKQEPDWNNDNFQLLSVQDKIKRLKNYLPNVMVNNANIYAILSKGIHELTEEECLKYYATIKMGIELILDEEIQRIDRDSKTKQITDEIGRITGHIG